MAMAVGTLDRVKRPCGKPINQEGSNPKKCSKHVLVYTYTNIF
jgi:hypothetical protein